MELDFRQLMNIARRRLWIVFLLMIVAGTSAYISSSHQTPMYSATATVLINPGVPGSSSDYNNLQTAERLAVTYEQLINTQSVRDRVAEMAGVDEFDEGVLSTSIVTNSRLIKITVHDTDPAQAALLTNTVVTEFQNYIAELNVNRAETIRSGIDARIEALEQRQSEIDKQLTGLDAKGNSTVQRQIEDLIAEGNSISQSLLDLNTSAITFDTQTAASSVQIEMADPAREPKSPFSPLPMRSLMLGLVVGALLGMGLVALLEFLDNTVKPEVNVQGLAGSPVLATIATAQDVKAGAGQVFTMTQPRSSAAESMRLLRTNLDFAATMKSIRSLTISSPSPGEGKSTITANLGVVMAQSGLAVVVIDADLRKPTQNRIFGVDNAAGLTTMLTHPDQTWQTVAKKVALPGLYLIPSGPIPPNPTDLLSSDRFSHMLDRIKEEVDMIIIDSPPVLATSDALVIAKHTDGLMLVCQSHKTRTDALRHAAHAVQQGGVRLVGIVLNRQKGQHGASYYGEYYGERPETSASSTIAPNQ